MEIIFRVNAKFFRRHACLFFESPGKIQRIIDTDGIGDFIDFQARFVQQKMLRFFNAQFMNIMNRGIAVFMFEISDEMKMG